MLSGKKTSLFDFPYFGKFISSGTKFDVAPESVTNFIVCCLSTRRVHFVWFCVCDWLHCFDCVCFFDVVVFFCFMEWGPVVCGSQVSVSRVYFIRYHFSWLPRF